MTSLTVCEAWGASQPVESQAATGDANQAFPVISRGNWIWKCGFLTSFVAIHGCRALLLIGCARSSGVDRGKDGNVPGLVTWANRNAYTAHTTQFASQNEVPCGWSSGVGMHGDLLHRGKDSGPGPKGDPRKAGAQPA